MQNEINKRYRLKQKLGEGGMGAVYLAEDKVCNNQEIAVKIIRQDIHNTSVIESFKNEFEIMTRLKHPNLIQVYDFGFDKESSQHYMTMEYLDGKPLSLCIAENLSSGREAIALHHAFEYMVELLRAVEFIHSRNILHRDIKPGNVILSQGRVKLMDFGLADLGELEKKNKGTLFYMAPEIFQNSISNKIDLYALGVTFFEIVTTDKEFNARHSKSIINYLTDKRQFEYFRGKLLEALPDKRLQNIIGKMIAFEPQQRYSYATEILLDINSAFGTTYTIETEESKDSYVLGAGFVGRETEFAQLKQLLEIADTQCLHVYGDAGIGKSRLMSEFKKYCQLNDILFLEAGCFETTKTLYHPFLSLINECLYISTEQMLKDHGPEIKKLLPVHEKLQHIQQNNLYDPKSEQRILNKHITELFIDVGNCSRNQVVLYLNDIQWIDEASLEIVGALLTKLSQIRTKTSTRLKIILSSRKEGLEYVKGFLQNSLLTSFELKAFDKTTVELFFTAVFGIDKVGKKLLKSTDRITTYVEGNPFYLQEIIRSLVASDAISHKINCWELTIEPHEIEVPRGIEELLLQRYKRLNFNHNERTVLEVLSLLDREITYEELNSIIPVTMEIVSKLDYYEIIKKEITEEKLSFKIQHDLIRHMILQEIRDTSHLHNHIALKLEEIHRNSLQDQLYALAHHYFHGNNREKAVLYGEKAIEKALYNREMSRSLDLCNTLLSCCEHDEKKRMELLVQKCDICTRMSNLTLLESTSAELFKLSEKNNDIEYRAKCHLIIGIAHIDFQNFLQGVEYLEKAQREFIAIDDKKYLAKTLNYLGLYHLFSENYCNALELFQQASAIAEVINDEMTAGHCNGNIGIIYQSMGEYQKALNFHMKTIAIMAKDNNKHDIAIGYENIALVYADLNEYTSAIQFIDKAITIMDEIEMHCYKAGIMMEKAEILFSMGQIHEAETCANESHEMMTQLKMGGNVAFRLKLLFARIARAKKNNEEAIVLLKRLTDEYTEETCLVRIRFELWQITRDEPLREELLNVYRKLFINTSKHEYRKCIEELERYSLHSKPMDDEHKSNPDIYTANQQTLEVIKQQLDMIQGIFQNNDLKDQIQYKETNSLLYKTFSNLYRQFYDLQSKWPSVDASISEQHSRIEFFQNLLSIMHDLNSNLSLQVLLERILDACLVLMGAQRGFIFLQNEESVLELKVARNYNKENIDTANYKISQTVIQNTLEKQEALFINNVADQLDLMECQSIVELQLRSVMCAPIGRGINNSSIERRKYPFLTASQQLGLIYIDSTTQTQQMNFISSNLSLFQALVDQASVAIVNTMLYENVNIDKLTGLFLRSFFETNLEQELAYCHSILSHCAIMMIDIDFFKMINDRHGHQTGDQVLKILGGVLKAHLRTTDICGRYGGEEFIMILPNTDLNQAVVVAQKLQDTIAQTSFPSGTLTVSIGISGFPEHCREYIREETGKHLIRYADQALYVAKNNGRNQYEIWNENLLNFQPERSWAKEILTGNPIRDYKNVEMLLSVIRTITTNINNSDVLTKIIDLILKSLDANRGMIIIPEEMTGILRAVVARDRSAKDIEPSLIKFSKKTVDLVLKTGKEICINAIEEEFGSQSIKEMEINSIMCVALYHADERVGVIYIDSNKQLKEFNSTELSFFNAIATQVSLLLRMESMMSATK